jgi:hypothetical protein
MTLFDERDEILVPDEGPGTELEGGDLAVVDELVERRPADAEHLGGVADGMYKWGLQNKVPLNLKEAGCIPLRSEVPPCSWENHGECRAPRRCVLCSWDRPSGRVRPSFRTGHARPPPACGRSSSSPRRTALGDVVQSRPRRNVRRVGRRVAEQAMVEFLEPNVAVIEGCLAGAGTQGRGSPSLDPCQDAILSASGLR